MHYIFCDRRYNTEAHKMQKKKKYWVNTTVFILEIKRTCRLVKMYIAQEYLHLDHNNEESYHKNWIFYCI